jgi:fused signal recognition particle receptor
MSGFFKKLFNRISGKAGEGAPPEAAATFKAEAPIRPEPEHIAEWIPRAEPVRVQAPEPEPEPAKQVEPEPAPAVIEAPAVIVPVIVPEPEKARPAAKRAEPKKPESKTPEPKRAEAKKAPAKKAKVPKPEPAASETVRPLKPAEPPEPLPIVSAPAVIEPEPGIASEAIAFEPEPEVAAPLPPLEDEVVIHAHHPREPEPIALAPAWPQMVDPHPAVVPPPEPLPEQILPNEENRRWLSRLRRGLSKSSRSITGSITSIFTKRKLDAATLQDLEDVLLQADLGLPMTERIVAAVSAGRYDKEIEPGEVKRILASEVSKVLKPVEVAFNFGVETPFVVLVVGVNGAGKTTTIGKLGAIAAREGYKVIFAACDTFRAAAIEQLTVWGKRIGARVMSRPTGADAAGLAFDAMKEARETATDILFIDTAGRLQNKAYLMDELDKVVRVIKKQDATAPHAVLLVLDATTGQNAIAQAEIFTKVAGVTGLIMTKLDGTARGGILVAIAERFKLPVHAIGVGEQIDDLQLFDADAFASTIAGLYEEYEE